MSNEDWLALNRASWNERTPIHVRSRMYDVEGFKAGRNSLVNGELDDLGDVTGKSLCHLQCHFGLDTMSFARAGAQVTGLDFSGDAVATAQQLAGELGLNAAFVMANVYDAAEVLGRQYDIVYSGIGAICWLPDMDKWAAQVAALVRPGGEFYFVEFHPLEWIWDDDFQPGYDYFTPKEGLRLTENGTYTDYTAEMEHNTTVQWNHSLGEVVTALVKAGLTITSLTEHPTNMVKGWDFMVDAGPDKYTLPDSRTNLPFMYTLRASKL